jgi:hypothetical protein
LPDTGDLVFRARSKNHSIGCKALAVIQAKLLLHTPIRIYKDSSTTVSGCPARSKPELCDTLLACEASDSKFTAILPRHHPLDSLHYETDRRIVVLENLGTVVHRYPGLLADKLIMPRLVHILEATPPAYVIDENSTIRDSASSHICQQLFESWTILQ